MDDLSEESEKLAKGNEKKRYEPKFLLATNDILGWVFDTNPF